jgi:hypothetical protein
MDSKTALDKMTTTMNELIAAGFMLEGSLTFMVPKTPGLVECRGEYSLGPVSWIVLTPTRRDPPSLPTLSAENAVTILAAEQLKGNNHGMTCSACGSPNLKPSGTCFTCMECGSTTGCG